MKIEKEIKGPVIEQRLQYYKKRYFELELDKIALLANRDTEGVKEVEEKMRSFKIAYEAIEAINIEE